MAVKRLGKGLGALIPEVPAEDESKANRLRDVEVSSVTANPFQPRETFDPATLDELKRSIFENGVIQPISVRETAAGYELIAGERRLRAVRDLGLERIPAFVLDVATDQEMLELSLIENIQRENLNPIDEANGYQALISKCNLTQDEVARRVGKDRSTITNALRILKLPQNIQGSLAAGDVSAGHARALLGLSDRHEQIALWKKIIEKKLSVRQVEELVKKGAQPAKTRKTVRSGSNPFIKELEDRLRSSLSTQVRIDADKSGKGTIEIEFYSSDDLERLIEMLD